MSRDVAMNRWISFALVLASACPVAAQSTNTANGIALGGVAGAITGGLIGKQNRETPEGALIGGAVGAIAGGLIGHSKDKQFAQNQYYQRQAVVQQQVIMQHAVSMSDVINMSRSGLGDSLIVNHIQTNGVQQHLNTHDIIYLHNQGVSENVISAMQNASLEPVMAVAPVPVRPPRTVVVEREFHTVAPRYVPHHYYRPAPYPYRRPMYYGY